MSRVFLEKTRINYLIAKKTLELNTARAMYHANPKKNELKRKKDCISDSLDALYFDKLRTTFTNRGISKIIQEAPAGGSAKDYAIEKLCKKYLKKLAKANSLESILNICKKQKEIGYEKVQSQICEKALVFTKNYRDDLLVLSLCPDNEIAMKVCKKAIDDSISAKQISYICRQTTTSAPKKKILESYARRKWVELSNMELVGLETSEQAAEAFENSPEDNEVRYEIAYAIAMLKVKEGKITASHAQPQQILEPTK